MHSACWDDLADTVLSLPMASTQVSSCDTVLTRLRATVWGRQIAPSQLIIFKIYGASVMGVGADQMAIMAFG